MTKTISNMLIMERQVLKYFLILAAFMIGSALYKLFLPKIRGKEGEAWVRAILTRLSTEDYCVLNDIMLKTDRGTSQIDHVVISRFGIFVIETKNYSGLIFGSESSEEWTENFYGKKYRFRNPIKQNYGHVKALENALELPDSCFVSIVAFSAQAKLRVKDNFHHLIHTSAILRTIKSYQQPILTEESVQTSIEKLRKLNITDKSARKGHVTKIRNDVEKSRKEIANGICPKCGGKLVQRHGKYGTFFGCSNYPKCRYTKQA